MVRWITSRIILLMLEATGDEVATTNFAFGLVGKRGVVGMTEEDGKGLGMIEKKK